MDHITFHHDTVLSDVHMLQPNASHLMTRLNSVGQPVFLTKFRILSDGEKQDNSDPGKEAEPSDEPREGVDKDTQVTSSQGTDEEEDGAGNVKPFLDVDGDLDIKHRPRNNPNEGGGRDLVCPVILKHSDSVLEEEDETSDDEGIIKIEHTMATTLEDVGKQVWLGAFLLADFILSKPHMFRGATVLELGAGTGLTSIVMATVAKMLYCTDVGEDLLSMCRKNVTLNQHIIEPAGGEVRVRQLDWLQYDLCTDADMEFRWTEEEVADLYDKTKIIIAADVCYDDDLTDGLFRTLYRLCSNFRQTCTIFISLEKRMNFTLRHMDVSCDAYNHFSHCLSQLEEQVDGRCSFTVEQLPSDFAQFLLYERIEQLELWKVTATPLPVDAHAVKSAPTPKDTEQNSS
ncbi:methyltransferase-like protein 22 [Pungitius pungitius]|uniref:methyltransferase-like protein 22 n=1 Tax=Pungitius pungitius TaxID=134920 RepID=UPI002E147083